MTESILFKNIQLCLPTGIFDGDCLVENGKITQIGPSLTATAEVTIDERGLTLLPGIIDPHVHFREPGHPHKETICTGSKAAVAGGVTSFFEMPNTSPACTTAERIAQKKQIASETSLANYNFFIAAAHDNLSELQRVENIPGIKIFVGSSTGNLLVDDQKDLERIFAEAPHLIAVHSEDETMVQENQKRLAHRTDVQAHNEIRTPEAAITCTRRLVELAKKTGHRLHICHLTTKEEAEFLASVPKSLVTTEVSPQHLLLNDSLYDTLGTKLQINPPIRDRSHQQKLFEALKSGTIDMIATDHAPHTIEEKAQPYPKSPSGMPGVQTSLTLMLDQVHRGLITLEQLVHWMCAAPAKIYNIQNKGQLTTGFDADLVIIDRKKTQTITDDMMHSNAKWTAFDGWSTTGWPVMTVVNGQIVYREGDFFEVVKGKEVQIG